MVRMALLMVMILLLISVPAGPALAGQDFDAGQYPGAAFAGLQLLSGALISMLPDDPRFLPTARTAGNSGLGPLPVPVGYLAAF